MTTVLDRRARLLGPQMTTFYREPVHVARGEGAFLWDTDGRKYLDCYNNVPHVGHCHPRVVDAICQQAATLNTHTRYVHDMILDYGDALTAKFGPDLESMVMVCSGSEANDVALRMAQAMTGKTGIIGTDNTYHGNTTAVSQLNSSKVPVGGYQDHVRQVPAPDNLEPVGGTREGQAEAFAKGVEQAVAELEANGHGVSALIVCPYFANEGFPTLEAGFLHRAIDAVRKAGGLIIADEVQPGFGRIGTHWWGHEKLGFTPDIVTLGKPMGNGHPVAAVVTRQDVLACFQDAFKYFNTFGGNPVSAAAAMAVLSVIEDENLVENARDTGAYAVGLLEELAKRHDVIADVRGSGLFFGAELWRDGKPATDVCSAMVDEMRDRGVLLHSVGRYSNTLKVRPPCVFNRENADQLAQVMDEALGAVT
ncbi:aminotransferase class III-fold pyridoxal phosphate-dependent enzyme [Shimia thalassica]|uniref:aspartate aminotransferase family protein n=1 Tax=Shimia thalassica TaxID=1715693 RepID=UPI001C09A593|nr:aminotransferase class III-fold pyridoxal phosphate-dependent enzyme [Shimia thalassica]MBU2942415.1 aminotransferase class III-fold pyridoxal phosphate-dependent enzyme [Shimia thalassica]MDO6485403.1 aminotransferase class III-fold pyridoxal phosphate-dependent enzyme [Shimia thalassica]MDO6504343.1 aminotransferase class III-fold pyridoxal phosphate-dependent enzyme [Shimia thalassica]